ncbi:hypothetical protein HWV62_25516 [Athelia sp. TMB]|nr:hypothetical protein HWV62_25516 [Athelia sp. TMB]
MPRRPTSSAGGSARPYTSGGFRPSTANHGMDPGAYDHEPQYTYGIEEDEEEEESDTEDLFAFLPPSTADQQQQHQEHTQSQAAKFEPNYDDLFAATLPAQQTVITPPAPTFDPYARYPGDSTIGPSSLASLYHPTAPVESPPSTDSQTPHDDPYRMRRIHGQPPTTSTTRVSGISSRELHVGLPSSPEKTAEEGYMVGRHGKKSSTLADTFSGISFSPSMMDNDSREGSVKMEFDFDAIDEEDSPYPEVRASVSNIDDPDMPALTIRMWIIGLTLCLVSNAANTFFNFRYPAPNVGPLTLLLISYPIGKFMAYTLPITTYRLPRWLGGFEFSLNPGPWNVKEHVLVFIMANVAVGPAYALNIIVVAEKNYGIDISFGFSLTIILATQLTGFGLAGITRRFLVWPASMVWPQNLVVCTLLNTLHAEEDEGSGGVSRLRYFMYVMGGAFFFFFLPVNQVFGVYNGLGASFLTFDWTEITWIGSPLMVPWWAQVHVMIGFVIFFWIAVPVMYYTNTWNFAHFPMFSEQAWDRFGDSYNISRIITSDDRFNVTAYNLYSPLYLSAGYSMAYFLAFALATCILVHTALYHGASIINGLKRVKVEPDDIHAKLMRHYPEVPDWWYMLFFLSFFCMAILANEVGLNLLSEVIPGRLLPGNPLANMIFKAYSVQTLIEASAFVQDLKLGHYVKVPPRAIFAAQAVATIASAFTSIGVKQFLFANVKDMCAINQKDGLTCPHNTVFFAASAVWGLIGPDRTFGTGTMYHPQLYALIVGAFLPIPFWLWQRRYPTSWTKFISIPVVLNGVSSIPPAVGINFTSWFAVGFVFQYLIRRRNFAWWSKFNYITSAAMDSGTVISLIFIFFTLQLPKGGVNLNWWGNDVFARTLDWDYFSFKPVPANGIPLTL